MDVEKTRKTFTIPPDFPRLMKDFTREVLRSQPDNIYLFGARYFAQRIQEREQAKNRPEEGAAPAFDLGIDIEEMQNAILECFLRADKDGSGTIDRREFRDLIRSLGFPLTRSEILHIMSEADENADGLLEYQEFLPIMVQIVYALRAKAATQDARAEEEERVQASVEDALLRGMPREDLEALMRELFQQADVNGNGTLSRKEFYDCLRSERLGLTRKDINVLMSEIDINDDGEVSWEEFVPTCFNILVERFKYMVMHNQALRSDDALEGALIEEFAREDQQQGDAQGFITPEQVKRALQRLSDEVIGLSKLQVLSVVSAADVDQFGKVDLLQFAQVAAGIIWKLVDSAQQQQRVFAINELATRLEESGATQLTKFYPEQLREIVLESCQAADADGSGLLERRQLEEVIDGISQKYDVDFSPAELACLKAAIEVDTQHGMVAYARFAEFVFEILEHLAREEYIQGIMAQSAAAGGGSSGQEEEQEEYEEGGEEFAGDGGEEGQQEEYADEQEQGGGEEM